MNHLVTCKYNECNKYLLEPVLLPCSKNVCKCHFDELIRDGYKSFRCVACNIEHVIPLDGFILNTFVTNIIDLKLHLNDQEKKVLELMNDLEAEVGKLEEVVQDPESFISENISATRNKIDLKREQIIYEINTLSDKMLAKLKKYEDDCKINLKKLNDLNGKHKASLLTKKNYIHQVKEELRIPTVEQNRIEHLLNTSNQYIKELKACNLSYKNNLLANKTYSFTSFDLKFKTIDFGLLHVTNLESSNVCHFQPCLLSQAQTNNLIKLCEFDQQAKFILLYQATKDGFSTASFHAKCDGIPNTLTVVKVKGNSNVFGGFCRVPWDQSNEYKYDPNAFIFSLINKDNLPLKINACIAREAIYCRSDHGPTFGEDINILNDSNKNQLSYSNLGYSYVNSLLPFESIKAKSFLAGSFNFATDEIEVYQVI